MPSGPKKRKAARRRKQGSPGSPYLDGHSDVHSDKDTERASVGESHLSDEGIPSPDASEVVNRRLELDTKEGASFQTEEWVRVSDFDVGTPTSTTAHSKVDYDGAAEDSCGDARDHDKLADWETVSRYTGGGESSAEDVTDILDADQLVVDDEGKSPSEGHGEESGSGLLRVSEGSFELPSSDKQDYGEHNNGCAKEEDRASSIVVVTSEDQDSSLHSSIVEVTSQEDDDHASSIGEVAEEQEDEGRTCTTAHEEEDDGDQSSNSGELALPEKDKGWSFQTAGVSYPEKPEDEEQASRIEEIVSQAKQEDGNPGAGDVDGGDGGPGTTEVYSRDGEDRASTATENRVDEGQVSCALETPVEEEGSIEAVEFTPPGKEDDEDQVRIGAEVHTPGKEEDKDRSMETVEIAPAEDQKVIREAAEFTPPEEQDDEEQERNSGEVSTPGKEENEDQGSGTVAVSPSESYEDDHGSPIAELTSADKLGDEEGHLSISNVSLLLQQEEERLSMDTTKPPADKLTSIEASCGEVYLQPVAVEATPLNEESDELHDATLRVDALPTDGQQEFSDSGPGGKIGMVETDSTTSHSEEKEATPTAQPSSGDLGVSPDATLAKGEEADSLVHTSSEPGAELPNVDAEPSKDADAAILFGKGLNIGSPGGPAIYLFHFNSVPSVKSEVQARSREQVEEPASLKGCCGPINWLVGRLLGRTD